MKQLTQRLAEELAVREQQVDAAVQLLDGGATVPFVARYRKEATGGLDDTQLRRLEERLGYLRELDERRTTILESIREQGKLTPELEALLLAVEAKNQLEDLYLPYRPKRRTKAQIAREAGLEPLAQALLADPLLVPEEVAVGYVRVDDKEPDRTVKDVKAALDGARQILMETWSEDAALVGRLREYLWQEGALTSQVVDGKQQEGAKFSDYFDCREPMKSVPSHRALAMLRGRQEGILRLSLSCGAPVEGATSPAKAHPCESMIAAHVGIAAQGRPADRWLLETVSWAWRVKISLHLETDLMMRLREAAEDEAITVFAKNLHAVLLASPAGQRVIMGLDPGLRSGVKVAVVDATGKLEATATIYPHVPRNEWESSLALLAGLVRTHRVELISIGNGTASRETDRLVLELVRAHPEFRLSKMVVSEAGASVYSASELAAREFPDLDVTLRGAVSIARRMQDPLAELVKIDAKAIGVGQYQHDVNQPRLARTLDAVVEDCVNAVGVEVNTASVPLLARVSGFNETLARNVVAYRDANGPFRERRALRNVPRLGEKAFEQAAGFLRIRGGDNPLDASAVHPEAYPVVERILHVTGQEIGAVIGNRALLTSLTPTAFTDAQFGLPTVMDILAELEKPGRDPRPTFQTATFKDGVEKIQDLKPGMRLEGVVTNVTNFGAFVDIGVHQDGLVHISALANSFVKDPYAIVKVGDVVQVKVVDVDLPRQRIGLTMRLQDDTPQGISPAKPTESRNGPQSRPARQPQDRPSQPPPPKGAMAEALAKAMQKREA
jgi:uncharacterized protein